MVTNWQVLRWDKKKILSQDYGGENGAGLKGNTRVVALGTDLGRRIFFGLEKNKAKIKKKGGIEKLWWQERKKKEEKEWMEKEWKELKDGKKESKIKEKQ